MNHSQQSSMKQGEYIGSVDGVKGTKRCYECGEMRHLRKECLRLQQRCCCDFLHANTHRKYMDHASNKVDSISPDVD